LAVDTSGGPPHILSIAFDGYPIYGARDIDGNAVPVSSLYECNGIVSPTPEFPTGIYHYVLPGTLHETSSIRCFHGTVDPNLIVQMPPMGPPPADAAAPTDNLVQVLLAAQYPASFCDLTTPTT
jgi:hypothetical protein